MPLHFRLHIREKGMLKLYLEFIKPLVYLAGLIIFGSIGYYYIADWTLIDSVYMTVITITTVGFGEVHRLTVEGKIFTIFLVLGGVGFYGLAINAIVKTFLEKSLKVMVTESRMLDKINKLTDHYIICGGGRMANSIAIEFEKMGKRFVIIENNPDSVVNVKKESGWLILQKDALIEESLVEAGIHRALGLASVLPTDADNLFVVLSARSLNSGIRIETRIAEESSRSKMLQAGANKVVSPYVLGGLQMARSFLEPEVEEIFDVILDKSNYEFELKVYNVESGDPAANKTIRETDFRKNGYIIIGVKQRDGQMVHAPQPDYMIRAGHEIVMIGSGKTTALE